MALALPLLLLGVRLSSAGPVFLSGPAADTVLQRHKRHNSGLLMEELLKGNLERECVEEICDFEEAREIFENNEKSRAFWAGYVDGNQCEPNPCLNQGTCEDHIGSYGCKCPSDVTGRNCEIVVPKRCDVNNGDCEHFCEPSGSKCSCATGYRLKENGFDCEPEVAFPCGRTAPAARPVARRSVRGRETSGPDNATTPDSAAAAMTPPPPPWEEPTEAEEQPRPIARIVGGTRVTTGEIPWQAALMARAGGPPFCGASILGQRWVVTAAHCLAESRGAFFIRVGENELHVREGTEQDYDVLEQHIHPRYNATLSLYNHDIALLRTEENITFSRTARPICVGPKAFTEALVKEASPATVSGWGRQRYLGAPADALLRVEVPFVDRMECKRSSGAAVTSAMFCAGYHSRASDACQGDSGGPHANALHDTWFLTGIVSWGEECARRGKYGVYTRVSHYYPWINRVMGIS
ncbi:coagulation factor IXa isoform X2 [Betta splendens]|uniref:Coagulation factor IX n=1 Tax=Betta splendens TaxID=158456 RepID=A0A6P7NK77_BETSP|nr:coagulation factor IXa isoform X2 [Betta splendens]